MIIYLPKKQKTMEWFLLGLLFLFAIAFMNWTGYIFAVLTMGALLLWGRSLYVGKQDLILFLFSVTYFFFYTWHFGFEIRSIIVYLWGP